MSIKSSIRQLVQKSLGSVGTEAIPHWQLSQFAADHVRAELMRNLLESRRIDCVFDVGAFDGHFGRFLRGPVRFEGLILSFEPQPDSYAQLSESAAADDKWHVFNLALGSVPGRQEMNLMEKPWFSSLLEPSEATPENMAARNSVKETATVEVATLDAMFPRLAAQYGFQRPFLKMDTQGFDLEVFKGGAGSIERFLGMQSEVAVIPIYRGAPSWRDALAVYEQAGFEVSALFEVSRTEDLRVVEFDAILARGQRAPQDRSAP
jgi:FkbM family methyltransferase